MNLRSLALPAFLVTTGCQYEDSAECLDKVSSVQTDDAENPSAKLVCAEFPGSRVDEEDSCMPAERVGDKIRLLIDFANLDNPEPSDYRLVAEYSCGPDYGGDTVFGTEFEEVTSGSDLRVAESTVWARGCDESDSIEITAYLTNYDRAGNDCTERAGAWDLDLDSDGSIRVIEYDVYGGEEHTYQP